MRRYILHDRAVVPFVGPLKAWAQQVWDDEPGTRVGYDRFDAPDGGTGTGRTVSVSVSTVFLGLDHNWGEGPPLIFETMVFGGPDAINGEQVRTSTWAEAEQAHAAMCRRIQDATTLSPEPESEP